MTRLLGFFCCLFVTQSETLPFTLGQTIKLEDKAVDIDMAKDGEYLYVTSHSYGIKMFVRQNGRFEEDVL